MRTKSEGIFEEFLIENDLEFKKIKESNSPRPDYLVIADGLKLVFEVKELTEDNDFNSQPLAVSSRIVGEHVRKSIHNSKKQIQFSAKQGIPSILLIYNNIDPIHLFGTEDHDFISAMYGEYTVGINKSTGKITESFHGKNQSLSEAKNTSFAAVGRLAPCFGKIKVTLFENVFTKVKIQYQQLPPCFDVKNIRIDSS